MRLPLRIAPQERYSVLAKLRSQIRSAGLPEPVTATVHGLVQVRLQSCT